MPPTLESLEGDAHECDLSPELRQLLDERLAAHVTNPADVIPWEQVRAEGRALRDSSSGIS